MANYLGSESKHKLQSLAVSQNLIFELCDAPTDPASVER